MKRPAYTGRRATKSTLATMIAKYSISDFGFLSVLCVLCASALGVKV